MKLKCCSGGQRVPKGPALQCRAAIAFRLLLVGESWWQWVNLPHLVALIHARVNFSNDRKRILSDISEESKQAVFKVQEDIIDLALIQNNQQFLNPGQLYISVKTVLVSI